MIWTKDRHDAATELLKKRQYSPDQHISDLETALDSALVEIERLNRALAEDAHALMYETGIAPEKLLAEFPLALDALEAMDRAATETRSVEP
jgi:hypothetical protein